RLPR
ncbi:secA DEAD-like domain protein, partial [Vibrio parahaemolyticus V-223/04]